MMTFKSKKNKTGTRVFLDGKRVGTILHHSKHHQGHQGFIYYPLGQKEGGEKFNTLDECKLSLQ